MRHGNMYPEHRSGVGCDCGLVELSWPLVFASQPPGAKGERIMANPTISRDSGMPLPEHLNALIGPRPARVDRLRHPDHQIAQVAAADSPRARGSLRPGSRDRSPRRA